MTIEISAAEFAERRAKATAQARERGLKGLLVCSRGGGTTDRYGDVMYLTNFYTAFPYIPDRAPDWTARAHAFVLLPVDGDEVLVWYDNADPTHMWKGSTPGGGIATSVLYGGIILVTFALVTLYVVFVLPRIKQGSARLQEIVGRSLRP